MVSGTAVHNIGNAAFILRIAGPNDNLEYVRSRSPKDPSAADPQASTKARSPPPPRAAQHCSTSARPSDARSAEHSPARDPNIADEP